MGGGPDQPKHFVHRARDCIEAGDSPAALAELERGVALHPHSPKLLFELGYLLYETGDTARSYELLHRAVNAAPNANCRVFFTLSEVSAEGEGWQWAQKGVVVGAEQLRGLQAELDALGSASDSRRSALLSKVTALRRVLAQGCCKLAELAAACDRPAEEALVALTEGSQLDPAYLEPYARLLLLHFNAQSEQAFDSTLTALLQRVRELEANDDEELEHYEPEFFNGVSRLLLDTGRLAEGVEWTETAAGQHPRDLMTLYLRAFLCWRAGELEEAAAVLEDLEELNVLDCGDEELVSGFSELRDALGGGATMGSGGCIEGE